MANAIVSHRFTVPHVRIHRGSRTSLRYIANRLNSRELRHLGIRLSITAACALGVYLMVLGVALRVTGGVV